MKCLHCGWCCFMYDVIIIAPTYATEKFKMSDINSENENLIALHKPTGKACPHVEERDELYFCKIHSMPWYKETPCYSHSQIESNSNDNCRMGEYILNNPKMKFHLIQILKGELKL